jgi:hypothetical protein
MRQHLAFCEYRLTRLGGSRNADAVRPPSPRILARYDRERLYEEVWSEPTAKVAHRYGISDVALSEVCKQLQIPKPPRGYWAKKKAGRPVPRRPKLAAFKGRLQ